MLSQVVMGCRLVGCILAMVSLQLSFAQDKYPNRAVTFLVLQGVPMTPLPE